MNIIARKPKGDGFNEYILVDRGPEYNLPNHGRFVSASANEISLKGGEWYSGFYFDYQLDAMAHFKGR